MPVFERIDETAVAEAIRRMQQDPQEHDRALIRETLNWTPRQRLQVMLEMLAFEERAHRARVVGPAKP